jgi:translation initiation factor IF-2
METEKQQAKQQAIWEADERRRKAVAEDAKRTMSSEKEEHRQRSHPGRERAARWRGNGERPSPFGSAATTPAPAGQSLGQAMFNRPPRDDRRSERSSQAPRNSRARDSSQSKSVSPRWIKPELINDDQNANGERISGFKLRKYISLPSDEPREDVSERTPSKAANQRFSRQPRETREKQPEKVAMPDFMLPQSSGAAAAPTVGWGSTPTEVKPLQYGDAPSNVEDLNDNPNVRDIRDIQHDGVDDARSYRELPTGSNERRLSFSHRTEEPILLEKDDDPAADGEVSAELQESGPSHASTLDSFGIFEDDDTAPSSQSLQDKTSLTKDSDPIPPLDVKRDNIAEAATFGGFEQSTTEEQSQHSSPEVTNPVSSSSPASTEPLQDYNAAAVEPVETSDDPADLPSTPSAPSAPAIAPTDENITQQAEPIRNEDVPPPAPAISPASPSAPSNSQTETDMIEKMRRMIQEYDRRHSSSAAVPTVPEPKVEQPVPNQTPSSPQPPGLGSTSPSSAPLKEAEPVQRAQASNLDSSPPTASKMGSIPFQNIKSPQPQHRLGDTGYKATPFNAEELMESSQAPAEAEEAGKWGLLRRRQDTKPVEDDGEWGLSRQQRDTGSAPLPLQPTKAPRTASQAQAQSQPQSQLQRTPKIEVEDADKLFEAHRATRTYVPPASPRPESYVFNRVPSDQDVSNKRCGRCGQMGHTAGMCSGPPRRETRVCHNCGKEGHLNSECPEQRRMRPTFKVFVGGVSPEATTADFRGYFSKFEGVVSTRLMFQQQDGPDDPQRSRGFGFVSFAHDEDRKRFVAQGPYTLLGKEMGVKLDQGSTRERTNQTSSNTTTLDRSENTRVANPFEPTEPTDGKSVVRRTVHEPSFEPSSGPQRSPRQSSQREEDDHSERRRGFKQAEPSSAPAEEPKRGAREARRRQWEEPEVEVERSDRGAERKGRRGNRREMEEDEEDERGGAREAHRARKAARQRQKDAEKDAEKQVAKRKREQKKQEAGTPITLPEFISVQHLSQALGVRYEAFVERLEDLGYDDVFAGKTLDSETSGMIAMEYNFDPTFDGGYREEEVRDLKARPALLDRESLPTRPPVVTIMGHVDHGKTTILDYLRKSSVAAGEAGGITQHIGAFSVPLAASGKTVTFLDTPGHAAFLAMRQRGANVTDMVILVVAADDSVKPQTLEAIRHAKEAGVPMIVALNKVDKPEADVDRCKQDLARHGVEIEDYGGDVQVVEVSGKTGKGMDALEENVVALSELLDHRAETDGAVEGWVLEATTRKAGRVATVLVRRGTLVPGAVIVAGKTWARVRTLRNEAGVELENGGPGMPVEVDGWRDQPSAGDEVLEAPTEQKAGSVVEFRIELAEREQTKKDMEIINTNRKISSHCLNQH